MKTSTQTHHGFTLTELLMAIAIMIILAGIGLASLGGIQTRANRAKAQGFIAELETGLGRYQVDFGSFPLNPETGSTPSDESGRDSVGQDGAGILYTNLSGDLDGDGELDENEPVYVENLLGLLNESAKNKRSLSNPNGEGFVVIDNFNNQIRYLADSPNAEVRNTRNPTFDLWSVADTGTSSIGTEDAEVGYITNWGN